jgi:hypothetical protein
MSLVSRCLSLGVVVVVISSASARAQDAPRPLSMVTYYECGQGDAARADAAAKQVVIPFLKSEQAAGRIAGYGWAEHVEGGAWRRLMYATATSTDALADLRGAMAKLRENPANAKVFDDLTQACPTHDDYIWRSVTSSQAAGDMGRVRSGYAMSTYYECSPEESEADAIVTSVIGPLLTARVKAGQIDSWNWMEHLFGGKYRRLLVIDGKDEKALLKNWDGMQDDLRKASPAMARRLGEICHSHADYIWRMGDR